MCIFGKSCLNYFSEIICLTLFTFETYKYLIIHFAYIMFPGERGGSVVECRTPEREVRGSRPTSAVLCP